jgi:hypothetical protein
MEKPKLSQNMRFVKQLNLIPLCWNAGPSDLLYGNFRSYFFPNDSGHLGCVLDVLKRITCNHLREASNQVWTLSHVFLMKDILIE